MRFVVTSVTGFSSGGPNVWSPGTGGRLVTVWGVLDSAYCYQIVRVFKGVHDGEGSARALAARLNAEDDAELAA